MTGDSAKPALLIPSSTRVEYTNLPPALEASLGSEFPQLRVLVARSEEAFAQELPECEILVTAKLNPEHFALCRKLRWIHSPMAGVTQLLFPRLVESNAILTNGRTVHSIPVAEQTLALMFALARRLPACFRFQAASYWGQDESWRPGRVPFELHGKTLGLVGLGAIGREMVARVRPMGMRVIAVKRDPSRGGEIADRVYSPAQLREMLPQVDFLVVCAPDLPETRRLIGRRELEAMKPTAFLVNVARGSLVDTEALLDALQAGVIAGAGLDVTDPEPLPSDHPLWKLPNVVITPHLGGASDRFWEREADLLRENLRRYLARQPLLNVVDKKSGY
jgi:phosphoglycerate dehydrogenase-like enzyme